MLFNSVGFLLGFLPITYFVFWRLKRKEQRFVWLTITGYVFIMPFILGFIFWFLIPALVALNLTFQKWNFACCHKGPQSADRNAVVLTERVDIYELVPV